MKKNINISTISALVVILFFMSNTFISPFFKSYGISDYYMDLTITNNGYVEVKEAFDLNGDYNGYERILVYNNLNLPEFDHNVYELGGNDLHNADNLFLHEVKGIDPNNVYSDNPDGDIFNFVDSSPTNNTYTLTGYTDQFNVKMYNPSDSGKAFYLDYTYSDMAIKHNDVGELGFNIFSEAQTESIEKMVVNVHIPGNEEMLEVYGHGYADAKIEIVDKENAVITITDIDANTALDIRVLFDSELLSDINYEKITGYDLYDQIIAYERRIEAEQQAYNNEVFIFSIVGYILLFCTIAIIPISYFLFDKEFEKTKDIKYIRELPTKRRPWMVSYLVNGKVKDNDIMTVISYLVNQKVLLLTPSTTNPDDFDFTYNENHTHELTQEENLVLDWFFKDENQIKKINMNIINAIIEADPEKTFKQMNNFKTIIYQQARNEKLFLANSNKFLMIVLSMLLTLPYGVMTSITELTPLKIILLIMMVVNSVYIITLKKRSKHAIAEYYDWISFKNFLQDFSKLDERELPEIKLWEHYLVYAIALGVNEEVTKQLAQMPSYQEYNSTYPMIFYSTRFSMYSRTFNSSMSSASASRMQSSSGGFSGGGGSFGGGGGGGRF